MTSSSTPVACRGMTPKLVPQSSAQASNHAHINGSTTSYSSFQQKQSDRQFSGTISSHNYSFGKGRSKAKRLTVPRRSLRLSSSSNHTLTNHKSGDVKPVDCDEAKSRPKEMFHSQSEERRKSQRIATVPLTNVLLNGCSYLSNSSYQNDVKRAQEKSRNHAKPDCTSSAVTMPLFTNNGVMTRSQAKSNDIQTIHISPIQARPSSLATERKYRTSRTVQLPSESQIYISPMYTPDLLSPTSSSKLDISIECHSRKSLRDLELCGTSYTGSKPKQEPEVVTSNNVVVALTVTEDDEQVGGMSVHDCPVHQPPPKVDHVACITIETGSQSEEQNRAPVEINIRPDLLNNLYSIGTAIPSNQ